MSDITTGSGARQVRAAGRLMTLLEDDPTRLPEVLHAAGKDAGEGEFQPRLVLGITGAPGSGKSTLTDALIAEFRRRHPERRIGIVAVDPSSPFTGGAVLGDRVRMMRHATDPQVFVRSMASRGHLGGLALGVRAVLHVMALLRCDTVLIETVGVGQSEVEVASVADLTAIVFAPGQGDSIQLLKAGLMEIGDLFVVNKADRQGAPELHRQLMSVLKLGIVDEHCGHHHAVGLPGDAKLNDESPELGLMRSVGEGRRHPTVHLVSATESAGVPELTDELDRRAERDRPHWLARRRRSLHDEIRDAVLHAARRRLEGALSNGSAATEIQRVLAGRISVEDLATELLKRV